MSSMSLICFKYLLMFLKDIYIYILYIIYISCICHIYKYILTGVDNASRHKVARTPKNRKISKIAFVLEEIYKMGGVFKYSKVFQCDNRPEFQSDVTNLLEK